VSFPVTLTAPPSLICNTRILALFENVSTGLATALRFSFATEAGGISPRLCIVRDVVLCSTVSASYTANSTVNTAEVDAWGGWTGSFAAPLSVTEASRIVRQGASRARAAPLSRALAVAYNPVDVAALQALLDAQSVGVLSIDLSLTTTASSVGQAAACLLSSGCLGGNASGVAPVSIAPPAYDSSGGAVVAFPSAGGAQAGAWAIAQVILALANATNSSPAAFSGFANLTDATISFEAAKAADAGTALRAGNKGPLSDTASALTAVGSLGAFGLLAYAAKWWWPALKRALKALSGGGKTAGHTHHHDGGALALRAAEEA
jgi:hypothetical protein